MKFRQEHFIYNRRQDYFRSFRGKKYNIWKSELVEWLFYQLWHIICLWQLKVMNRNMWGCTMYYFLLYFWWTINIGFLKNILRFYFTCHAITCVILRKYILTWIFKYLIIRFNTIRDYLCNNKVSSSISTSDPKISQNVTIYNENVYLRNK